MPYQVITLGQFIDQLSARLDDPTNSFFSRDELLDYTKETFRCWAAHTGYWVRRANFTPSIVDKDTFLPPVLSYFQGMTEIFPFALSLTDRDLVNSLLYALLEPPITNWAGTYPGTEQFDLPLLVTALEHAINTIQQLTSLVTTQDSFVVSPVPINQYDLAEDAINLRSVYWEIPAVLPATTSEQFPLARQDQYIRGLVSDEGTTPDSYSVVSTFPKRVELSPIPTDLATFYYLKVIANQNLAPTIAVAGNSIYLPQNFSWAAKWYSLFTLLNAEGERRDKFRADYCAMRVKDSLVLAKVFPGILRVFINDIEVQVTAAWDQDFISPNWRNETGTPDQLILHSWSTVSVHPLPTEAYSVTMDVSANAPIPASEAEYLDIGSDLIQTLLDYAHHLACFKMGGQEFADSIPSYQRFLLQAMAYNKKLLAESNNFELLKEKTDFPRRRKPPMLEEEAA